jgi:hypothetical protein
MKVEAHGPHAWFLLEDSGRRYLEARCSQSAADYTIAIELSAEEWREYHGIGRLYIDYLAARIQNWPKEYLPRQVSKETQAEINAAISSWMESN